MKPKIWRLANVDVGDKEVKMIELTAYDELKAKHEELLSYLPKVPTQPYEKEMAMQIDQLKADLAHMTEKFERNSIAAGEYSLEVDRLKRIIAKELSENDELGAEYTYVNVLKEHSKYQHQIILDANIALKEAEECLIACMAKFKADLQMCREALEDIAYNTEACISCNKMHYALECIAKLDGKRDTCETEEEDNV